MWNRQLLSAIVIVATAALIAHAHGDDAIGNHDSVLVGPHANRLPKRLGMIIVQVMSLLRRRDAEAAAAARPPLDACQQSVQQHCGQEACGFPTLMCLKRQFINLPMGCRNLIESLPESECVNDAIELCSDQVRSDDVLFCLVDHADKLSPECVKAFQGHSVAAPPSFLGSKDELLGPPANDAGKETMSGSGSYDPHEHTFLNQVDHHKDGDHSSVLSIILTSTVALSLLALVAAAIASVRGKANAFTALATEEIPVEDQYQPPTDINITPPVM